MAEFDMGEVAALVTRALRSLGGAFQHVLDPEHRLFWLYLLTSLALAVATSLVRPRGLRRIAGLFSPRIWLHRSALLDYKLFLAKPLIHAVLFAPWIFSATALAVWTVHTLDSIHTVAATPLLSPGATRVVYTLVLFVSWDFSRFALHSLAHAVPTLWELHKVHHSAEVMTPMTLYRNHPIENLLFQLRGLAVTGLVSGVFFHFFRSDAVQYEIMGVNGVGFVFNLAGGNLRHSHVWLPLPPWLERLLMSPAQHQLHHSAELRHCHKNLGSWLAVWDWLAGTLVTSRGNRPRRFGLPAHELNHSPASLGSALFGPLHAIARRLAQGTRSVP
ncbi:MAG: sterol desaturase family protein [Deltaproteobacteria bacterium]|nr:sterol desaturase family protein [Deltaproteobacteria bacterium]